MKESQRGRCRWYSCQYVRYLREPDDMASNHAAKTGVWFSASVYPRLFQSSLRALLSDQPGNKKSHELRLLREQWNSFKAGDVFKSSNQGVDSVFTPGMRKLVTPNQADKVPGKDD